MTGYSWSKQYAKKLISGMLIVSGSFLILEHLFNFTGFDIEILGHEYLGLFLIGLAFLLSMKWKQLPAFIAALKGGDWRKVLDEGERK